MEKGINLSLTKSLAEFDSLLEKAIEAVSSKKLSVANELDETDLELWKFQVGKYVLIHNNDEEGEDDVFWTGFGWEENDERESCIWLEFDAKRCTADCWEKINALVGTSGEYINKVDIEFVQVYMNAWVHFFLKEKYLKQLYDEKVDINVQKDILTGFISEVMDKI
jgi:hypothetical protein